MIFFTEGEKMNNNFITTEDLIKIVQAMAHKNDARFSKQDFSASFIIPANLWTLDGNKYAAEISTEGETSNGFIKIYAEKKPTGTISGTYHIFEEDSFIMKARVNSEFNIKVTSVIENVSIAGGSSAVIEDNISILDLSNYENKIESII